MSIGETLTVLRKESGLSQEQAAEKLCVKGCRVTRKAVSKWERGDTLPNAEQFLLLCRIYGAGDVLALFLPEDGLPELNDLGLRRLTEYQKLLKLDDKYLREPAKKTALIRSIPLYDLPASAGTGCFLDSDRYELIEADAGTPLCATFAVRVYGDSMIPLFLDGQTVYVKQQQTLAPGETGIFLLNGDAYIKQLSGENKAELISLNKKYAPICVGPQDELRVIGKVVGKK